MGNHPLSKSVTPCIPKIGCAATGFVLETGRMRIQWLLALGSVAGVLAIPWQGPASELASAGALSRKQPLRAPHHPYELDRPQSDTRARLPGSPRTAVEETRTQPTQKEAVPRRTSTQPDRTGPNQLVSPTLQTTAPGGPTGGAESAAPLPRPESPLTPEQEARLSELLERYKADQIGPEEYHRERARILRER